VVGAEFVMGKCALCLQDKELQQSHIIPNAFFKKVKRIKGEKSGHYISITDVENRWRQESYEESLLCWECEQKFSTKFEKYAIDLVLRNPANIGVTTYRYGQTLEMSGIAYEKLKLFQLSILWRASVSTNTFYSHIKLIPYEEERLRRLLFDLESTDPVDFGCFMSPLCLNNDIRSMKETKGFICTPFVEKNGVYNFYVFYFGGYEWRFANPVCDRRFVVDHKIISASGDLKCSIRDVYSIPVLFNRAFMGYKNQQEGNGVYSERP
jgi:hypothetical protein